MIRDWLDPAVEAPVWAQRLGWLWIYLVVGYAVGGWLLS